MPALKDITLGRYVKANSALHRLDPRTKFLATLTLMFVVFSSGGFASLTFCYVFLLFLLRLSRLPASLYLRNLRPFIWLFGITFLLNAILTPGHVLQRVPVLAYAITEEGIVRGTILSLRLSATILTASLLTLTTSPMELTAGIESLLRPLQRIGLPSHQLAMMVSVSLRFLPLLVEEAERLQRAQLARGANFGGTPIQRIRSLVPLLVPLFASAFDRADRLALALESRCYRPDGHRTHFHQLRYGPPDLMAAAVLLLNTVAVVCLRVYQW